MRYRLCLLFALILLSACHALAETLIVTESGAFLPARLPPISLLRAAGVAARASAGHRQID